MNVLNRACTAAFDVFLTPFELLGMEFTLITVSGIFGILALIVFKHISSQKRIKATKDKIKGHMIEIRLYQDDLVIVARAIGKVLLRNLQYLALNFGPILPLFIPFVFVLAQFVVRYAFDPVPVTPAHVVMLAGQGTMITVELDEAHRQDIASLTIEYPDGLAPLNGKPVVRIPAIGKAFHEIIATKAGDYEIAFTLGDGTRVTKRLVAGAETHVRWMQPERVGLALAAALWPVEETFGSDSGFVKISFEYPESDLGWLPMSGVLGVLVVFFVASMAFGVAILKPLGIQI
ncbi:MAG: hypothetical protein E2O39_09655 [Planctomycetota bacterium]|nr:MAG: hypothetical protein E2O39_09655 [Planctomycetota bacterium]